MEIWNLTTEPIANRLRDEKQLQLVQETKAMIYHQGTEETALIMDVWIVDPVPEYPETQQEDRYIRYTTDTEIRQDFAVDLDQEGWLWYDELSQEVT